MRATGTSSGSAIPFVGALGLVALICALILAYATQLGIGLAHDSMDYIAAARSLAEGSGVGRMTCEGFKPMVLWPPLYPATLALAQATFGDVFVAAKVVNLALLSVSTFLVGLMIQQVGRITYLSFVGAAIFGGSAVALVVFSWAMSDALFLTLGLATCLALARYSATSNRGWLLAGAILAGSSTLARYVGVALVLAGLLMLLWLNRNRGARLADTMLFIAVACAPLALWQVRNAIVNDDPLLRIFGFHPPGLGAARQVGSVMASWLSSFTPIFSLRGFAAATLAVVLTGTLLWRWHTRLPEQDELAKGTLTSLFLFATSYSLTLVFYLTFLGPGIPLDNRILIPLFAVGTILVASFAAVALRRRKAILAMAFVGLLLLLAFRQTQLSAVAVPALHREAQGYASERWRQSETGLAVRDLHPALVYTNDLTAAYFVSGQAPCVLPTAGNEKALEEMRADLRSRGGIVAVFGQLTGEFQPLEEIAKGMKLIGSYGDGSIYTVE